MTATIGAATSGSRPELISATYRRLRRMGFDDPEAADLTALKNGFPISTHPWKVRELAHLLFLRESRRVGRRWSDADDRVDSREGPPVPARVDRAPTQVASEEADGPAVPSTLRDGAGPADERITLLTLFRSMAGPNATLDLLDLSTPPRLDAAGDSDSEGG